MDVQIVCPCPEKAGDTRHPAGDTVTLRDRLDWSTVTIIRKAIATVDEDDPAIYLAKQLAVCTEFYMLLGITAWTFVDEKGKALPVSHAAIRALLERTDVLGISEAAEKLYNPVVLLPLLERASRSSPPTSTDESTSQPMDSPPRPPKLSKPSSTITTQTDGIETITLSPVGGSSSSQSSASAA